MEVLVATSSKNVDKWLDSLKVRTCDNPVAWCRSFVYNVYNASSVHHAIYHELKTIQPHKEVILVKDL